MQKRPNATTFKGSPLTLVGPELKPGDKAPDFTCLNGLELLTLAGTPAKARLFSAVPSLDTPVCSLETKKFNEALAALKDKVAAYTISLDLPFAQARFCTEANIDNLKNLSDAHDKSFGEHYGVLIQDLPIPLLARAVIVVDPSDTIQYIEIVPEIATEPNYEPALAALKKASGS